MIRTIIVLLTVFSLLGVSGVGAVEAWVESTDELLHHTTFTLDSPHGGADGCCPAHCCHWGAHFNAVTTAPNLYITAPPLDIYEGQYAFASVTYTEGPLPFPP